LFLAPLLKENVLEHLSSSYLTSTSAASPQAAAAWTLQRGKMSWVCISANWDHGAAADTVMGTDPSPSAGHITGNQVVFHVSSHFGE